jgi:ATP-dependent RNA helicase SUPV3L1/SUV3
MWGEHAVRQAHCRARCPVAPGDALRGRRGGAEVGGNVRRRLQHWIDRRISNSLAAAGLESDETLTGLAGHRVPHCRGIGRRPQG